MWKPPECTVSGGFFLLVGWFALCCGWQMALTVLGGGALAAVALLAMSRYYFVAKKQFGGITGDLAGWFLQRAELWMLAALAVSQWGGVL